MKLMPPISDEGGGTPHWDSRFFVQNMQIAAIKDWGDLHKAPSGKVHYTLMELEIQKEVPCAHV